jgi:uncharacterized membrane protein
MQSMDAASLQAQRLRITILAASAWVALGLWVGGLLTLGAIVAPVVFGVVPAPTSADAMTIVFRRFDHLAVACSIVVLGAEVGMALVVRAKTLDIVRGAVAVLMTACALGVAWYASPKIAALHAGGALRGFETAGMELERFHRIAEALAKGELALGIVLMGLYAERIRRG